MDQDSQFVRPDARRGRGTLVAFDCGDGVPLDEFVVVTSGERIVFNGGEVEYLLEKCQE